MARSPGSTSAPTLLERLFQLGFAALVGAAATVATGAFGFLNKDRELDLQMLDMALAILSGENTDAEKTIYARRFAIRTLSEYSGITITETEMEEWAKEGVIPRGGFNLQPRLLRPACPSPDPKTFSKEQHVIALARLIYGEARGEPAEARQGVANVVMNRIARRFGDTIGEVVYKPHAFPSLDDHNCWIVHEMYPGVDGTFDECYKIALSAANGTLLDNTSGATHYHADTIEPEWTKAPNAKVTLRAGRLIFYTGVS